MDCHKTVNSKKMPMQSNIPRFEPEDDLKCLIENERQLQMCGYYYGTLSWQDASDMVKDREVGTFIVRDSTQSNYLYTLTVQTVKGPTSCRMEYSDGTFRLDSARHLSLQMPRFESIPHLIDFYIHLPKRVNNRAVWIDMDEIPVYTRGSEQVPVQLCQPLYRQVRSLLHMCRVEIVTHFRMDPWGPCAKDNPAFALKYYLEKDNRCQNMPEKIIDYLCRYPYAQ